MALRTQQFTVSTTAVELRPTGAPTAAIAGESAEVWVTADATQALFLGPTNSVTASNGFKVPANTTVKIKLNPGERLWGIAGASGTVYVLRTDW